MTGLENCDNPGLIEELAADYFQASEKLQAADVDHMMSWVLAAEWAVLIALACFASLKTWEGAVSRLHPHVWTAMLAGPAFILPAIALAKIHPATSIARHAIAAAQALVSVVLIEITGGRIEAHFHVFVSLAFLASYRDWRVLLTASAITAAQHLAGGFLWPQAVYGELTVSPWRWVEHAAWVVFEDIILIAMGNRMKDLAVREAQFYSGAHHDALTGLPNRRHLLERFVLGGGRRALLFVDLDRFKQVNDSLGHQIGDQLLIAVAERLKAAVGHQGTLARIGGDEFVVLLDVQEGGAEAVRLGALLVSVASESFRIDQHDLLLSASVGIAFSPEHGTSLKTLQARADRAMYEAKALGRSRMVVFSDELEERDQLRGNLERDLYQAVSGNQFELYLQPIVSAHGSLQAFEALVRWNHPSLGLILPGSFIPAAERSGLIVGIGEWVLREACRACAGWRRSGKTGIGISVNVSGIQLDGERFAEDVLSILAEFEVPASLLTLEVTESVLMENMQRAGTELALLREAGVKVALDDFGTGYSGLCYLSSLPVDTIKLDSLFLRRQTESAGLLESMIQMAHQLGLRVVAEGVETPEQANTLRQFRCDELQGHYFGRPVPEAMTPQALLAAMNSGVVGNDSLLQLITGPLAVPEAAVAIRR